MTAQNRGLTGAQISMLEMLAGCPDGCSEAVLKANGFTIGSLGKLIRAGLATATPGIVEAGGRTLGVVRLGSGVASHHWPRPACGAARSAGSRSSRQW
jgi:hypothetical protein